MAVAGHIVANLTANTSGWASGLRGAISPLGAFATAVQGMALGAVLAFSSVGDRIDKMRARTGLTAVELSQLSHAAELSDTSLESLQSGLTKMNRFLRETSQGSKSANATLNELGLSAEQLGAMTGNEKLGAFADALVRIEDPGQRAAVAMEIFGKGAVDLLPLLAGGSAGLREMAAEADRLGITMDDKTATKAAQLNDTIGRLKNTLMALYVHIGSELAPVVVAVVSTFTDWVAENRELVMLLGKTAVVVAGLVLLFKGVATAISGVAMAQKILLAFSGPKGWAILASGAIALGVATYATKKAYDAVNAKLAEASKLTDKSKAATESQKRAFEAAAVKVQDYSNAMNGLKSAYDSTLSQSQQMRMKLQKMTTDWEAAKAAGQDTVLTWAQLVELRNSTTLGDSGWTSEFTSLSDQLALLRGEITETEQRFAKMAEFGVDGRHIDALRQMNEERNKLLSEQQAKEKEADERRNKLASVQTKVREANQTPLSKFAEAVQEVSDAMNAGLLTRAESVQFLESERKKLLDSEKPDGTAAESRKQASNTGLDARSAQANQLVVDLANRRGGGTKPQDKQLAATQRQIELEEQSAALLVQIRNDARRREVVETKPFPGRAG